MSHIKNAVANHFGDLTVMQKLFGSFTTLKEWMKTLEQIRARHDFAWYGDKQNADDAWLSFKGDMFEHFCMVWIEHYGNNKKEVPFSDPVLLDRNQRGFDIRVTNRDGLTTRVQCKYQADIFRSVKAENLDQMFIEHGAEVLNTHHNEMREMRKTDLVKYNRLMDKLAEDLIAAMYVMTTAKDISYSYESRGVKCIGFKGLSRQADGDETFSEKLKQSC